MKLRACIKWDRGVFFSGLSTFKPKASLPGPRTSLTPQPEDLIKIGLESFILLPPFFCGFVFVQVLQAGIGSILQKRPIFFKDYPTAIVNPFTAAP
jgi:hypothetical protein